MKTSEVFKQAKQHLAKDFEETRNDKEKFICIAITAAAAHCERITKEDVERCAEMVESRLEGAYTLEGWLNDRGCVPEYELCDRTTKDRTTKDRIQAHRHAWLDLLIAEFEAKGD
jgi:hypothetical protein